MNDIEKPRLARLTAILTQLQSKRLITAKEIADKHGVSIRTIYRDIRTLERSGVPIITEEGRGYTLVEGYHLPPVSFTEQEANALITAEQLIARNRDESLIEQYRQAMTKIKAVLRHQEKDKAHFLAERVVFRNNEGNAKTSKYLATIQLALTNFQIIQIVYTSLQGETSKRRIEPFAMYSTNDNWILIANCQMRADFRQFRLDCMDSLTLLSENFEPHPVSLLDYFKKFT